MVSFIHPTALPDANYNHYGGQRNHHRRPHTRVTEKTFRYQNPSRQEHRNEYHAQSKNRRLTQPPFALSVIYVTSPNLSPDAPGQDIQEGRTHHQKYEGRDFVASNVRLHAA